MEEICYFIFFLSILFALKTLISEKKFQMSIKNFNDTSQILGLLTTIFSIFEQSSNLNQVKKHGKFIFTITIF